MIQLFQLGLRDHLADLCTRYCDIQVELNASENPPSNTCGYAYNVSNGPSKAKPQVVAHKLDCGVWFS